MRESFVFHKSYLNGVPQDDRHEFIEMILAYAFDDIEPALDGYKAAFWMTIKARLDTDWAQYEDRKEKNRKRIQEWRDKHDVTRTERYKVLQGVTECYTTLQNVTPYTSTDTSTQRVSDSVNVSESVNVIESVNDNEFVNENEYVNEIESVSDLNSISTSKRECASNDAPPARRFKKPSKDEVEAVIAELSLNVDAEQFIAYYDSNGWKVGRNPMESWRAALFSWDKREKKDNGLSKGLKPFDVCNSTDDGSAF